MTKLIILWTVSILGIPAAFGFKEWTTWVKTYSTICRKSCSREEQFVKMCLDNGRQRVEGTCYGFTFTTRIVPCTGELCERTSPPTPVTKGPPAAHPTASGLTTTVTPHRAVSMTTTKPGLTTMAAPTAFKAVAPPHKQRLAVAETRTQHGSSMAGSPILWVAVVMVFVIGIITVTVIVVVRSELKKGYVPTRFNPAQLLMRTIHRFSLPGQRRGSEDDCV